MTHILFSSTHTTASKIIRALTRCKASHVVLLFGVEEGQYVVEATIGGVRRIGFDTWLKSNYIVEKFFVELNAASTEVAAEYVHNKYDYLGLVGFLPVVLLWRWFRKKISNPLASSTAVVCSELVVEILKPTFEFARRVDSESCTPKKLLGLLTRHSDGIKIKKGR